MKKTFSKSLQIAIAGIGLLSMTACGNMNHTDQSMLYGGAIGAGLGAATAGAYGGCIACGAAIGGSVGVASGYVADQYRYGR